MLPPRSRGLVFVPLTPQKRVFLEMTSRCVGQRNILSFMKSAVFTNAKSWASRIHSVFFASKLILIFTSMTSCPRCLFSSYLSSKYLYIWRPHSFCVPRTFHPPYIAPISDCSPTSSYLLSVPSILLFPLCTKFHTQIMRHLEFESDKS
jgi:hypothetical protein